MRLSPGEHLILFDGSSEINSEIVSVSLFHDEGNDSFHAQVCPVVPTALRGTLLRAKGI
jgi:hypothetical protein